MILDETASAGKRARAGWVDGSRPNHWTTDAAAREQKSHEREHVPFKLSLPKISLLTGIEPVTFRLTAERSNH